MAAISEKFGSGGTNLTPGGAAGTPSLATALRDIADDLANGKAATIASTDAVDLASALTLINEIKAALNTVDGVSLLTTKV